MAQAVRVDVFVDGCFGVCFVCMFAGFLFAQAGWHSLPPVRERAKGMYEFLNDNEQIKRARAEARKHVDKYRGFSNETMGSYGSHQCMFPLFVSHCLCLCLCS